MRILLLLFFATNFIINSQAQQFDESMLVASIQRTTCYGKCPYYEIKVYENGWATFEGKKNVEWIGMHKAQVGVGLVAKIKQKAEAVNYSSFNQKYPEKGIGIIDFPTCITSLVIENEKKIIYSRNDSPTKLVDYQEYFDELFEDVEWQKTNL